MKGLKVFGGVFILITTIFQSTAATGQIVMEKTYTTNHLMQLVNIEGDGMKYIGVDRPSNIIVIYNLDHTLWKTILTGIPGTVSYTGNDFYASRTLFDSDQDLELVVTYWEMINNQYIYTSKIINENGTPLWTGTPGTYSVRVQKANATDWKMLTHLYPDVNGNQHTDVWSLPGKYISGMANPNGGGDPASSLYPNPMSSSAKLSYHIEPGTSGTIEIHSMNGVKLRTYQISSQFNDILIERGDLPAGMYTYSVTSKGMAPVSKTFVIQ